MCVILYIGHVIKFQFLMYQFLYRTWSKETINATHYGINFLFFFLALIKNYEKYERYGAWQLHEFLVLLL